MIDPVFQTHWPFDRRGAEQELLQLEHSLEMLGAALSNTSLHSGNMVWQMLAEAALLQLDWTIEELTEWIEQSGPG